MHFSITLATVFALASVGSTFDIDVFDSGDCTGPSREVNVWDNTCATWMGSFSSYIPRAYGAAHQSGYFFTTGNCGDLVTALSNPWVDGGDSNFQIGKCVTFGAGHVANAAASYSS